MHVRDSHAATPPRSTAAPRGCARNVLRLIAIPLLLIAVVCTQGAACAEDHHHSPHHCCAICHAGTLPFLTPVGAGFTAPALPAVWFVPAPELRAPHASQALAAESRAPPLR